MKKTFQILLILLASIFMVSCKNNGDDDDTPQKFTVTFNANTGELAGDATLSIEDGGSVTEAMLPTASKTNHTFEGWFLNAQATGEKVTFPYVVTKDTVFYASYNENEGEVVEFTITIDVKGGTGGNQTLKVEVGQEIRAGQMPKTTKDGYNFLGWYMSVDGSDTKVTFPLKVTKDVTIFAKWEEISEHEITFDANGGTLTGNAKVIIEDGKSLTENLVPTVSYSNHDFLGWYLNKEGTGSKVTFPYKPVDNVTLYAVWKEKTVIIGDNYKYLYEAEDAEITGSPSFGDTFIEMVEIASGGKSIGNMSVAGNSVKFTINASKAASARIEFVFSASLFDYMGGMIVLDQIIDSSKVEIKLNGTVIDYEPFVVDGNPGVPMGFNEIWTTVSISDFELVEGVNELVLTAIEDEFPNFDCIMIKTTADLDGAKVPDTGGSDGQKVKYLYEAEEATHFGQPSYGDSFIEIVEIASGGKSVGNMNSAGNGLTFIINAANAGSAVIEFVFASSIIDQDTWSVADQTIDGTKVEIKLNGVEIEYEPFVVKGNPGEIMGFNKIWTTISLSGFELQLGENELTLTSLATEFPNIDCIMVRTNVELDGVPIADDGGEVTPPVEENVYEESIDAIFYVDALPGGPAFEKVVLDFKNDISKEELYNGLFEISVPGMWGTSKFTVEDIYLSDELGNKLEEATSGRYVTVVFSTAYGTWGFAGNNGAFTYNFQTQKNAWVDTTKLSIKLLSNLTIGDKEYTKLDASKITIEVIVPKLAEWDLSGEFNYNDEVHGDIKLTFAAYEPEKLKGSEKNPLIIWLHGGGEGGTDPSIAVLGNEITGISSEKIQRYFISGEEVGAYILAVQTPTMWMDDGTGEYGNNSMYLNALWATIKDYVNNNPDIDTERIYIGGCSNGGFMTMEMLISDVEGYFAAAFPICQAYDYDLLTELVKAELAQKAIWFIHAQADGTVSADLTNKLYVDLINLGAENVFYSLFDQVILDGVTYDAHWSWIYPLQDLAINIQKTEVEGEMTLADLDVNSTLQHPDYASMWQWLAAQKNN